jgi:hypothetical protein
MYTGVTSGFAGVKLSGSPRKHGSFSDKVDDFRGKVGVNASHAAHRHCSSSMLKEPAGPPQRMLNVQDTLGKFQVRCNFPRHALNRRFEMSELSAASQRRVDTTPAGRGGGGGGGGRALDRLKAFRCKHAETHKPRIESKAQSRKSEQVENFVNIVADLSIIYYLTFPSQSLLTCNAGSHLPRRPGFEPGSSQVGFVVDKVALGQVFSEYFGFPQPPIQWVPGALSRG